MLKAKYIHGNYMASRQCWTDFTEQNTYVLTVGAVIKKKKKINCKGFLELKENLRAQREPIFDTKIQKFHHLDTDLLTPQVNYKGL